MAKSSSGAEAGAFQRPEYTRSLLPEPSSFFNSEIIIIEPDGSRAVWYSDGTQWLPGGGTGASNFDQLTGDPLDNPALFGYLDGETGYCSGNNTISAAILAHVTKLRVFYGAAGPVTFAADCASNGRVMLMVAENGQPDFTVAFGPGVTVIQPPGTTLSSAQSADRSVSWICQVSGTVRVLSVAKSADISEVRRKFRRVAAAQVRERLEYARRRWDAQPWKPGEAIEKGMCRLPTAFYSGTSLIALKIHRASNSGTTGHTEPIWTTTDYEVAPGTSETTDGTVVWRSYQIYFIDSVAGNDSTGDGSQATPWQTLAKVTTYGTTTPFCVVRSGRAIALKRGSVFNSGLQAGVGDARLMLQRDVTDTQLNPERFNVLAYGAGSMPVIDGTSVRFALRTGNTAAARHHGFVTISGVECRGAMTTASGAAGMFFGAATDADGATTPSSVKVIDCRVRDITHPAGTEVSSDINGMQFFGADNGVYGCTIRDTWDDGIWSTGARVEIVGNNVARPGASTATFPNRQRGDCIQVTGSAVQHGAYVGGNIIDHSASSQKHSLILNHEVNGTNVRSENVRIEWNDIIGYRGSSGATQIGLYCSGFNGDVLNNLIDVGHTDSAQNAVVLTAGARFMGNLIYSRTGMRGVLLGQVTVGSAISNSAGAEVAYNTFVSPAGVGTGVAGSADAGAVAVHSNLLIGWVTGLDVRAGTSHGFNAYKNCTTNISASSSTATALGSDVDADAAELLAFSPLGETNAIATAGKVSAGQTLRLDALGTMRGLSVIAAGALEPA